MIEIAVETSEVDSLLKRADKLVKSNKIMDKEAAKAKQYAENYCPVDNGELIESIYADVVEHGFILGASAKHAVFNEYGCYNLNCGSPESPQPAKYKGVRPFIRPAILKVAREYPKAFEKAFQDVVLHG